MKWGIRRFQNPDGTLTSEGRARYYGKSETDNFTELLRKYNGSSSRGLYARIANSVQMKAVAGKVRASYEKLKKIGKAKSDIEDSFTKRKDYDKWIQKAAVQNYRTYQNSDVYEDEKLSFKAFYEEFSFVIQKRTDGRRFQHLVKNKRG